VIPQSFIADLLNRVDIVDVVGRYVQLKKGGANYQGLCPFIAKNPQALPSALPSSSITALAAAPMALPSAS